MMPNTFRRRNNKKAGCCSVFRGHWLSWCVNVICINGFCAKVAADTTVEKSAEGVALSRRLRAKNKSERVERL
jgi:hypothetical protein